MNKQKMLAGAGAGVVIVGLLAFQVYNGNLRLPSVVTSLWSHKAAGPMPRNFPSASAAPNLMAARPALPDSPPDSPPDTPPNSSQSGMGSESTANGDPASANPMGAAPGPGPQSSGGDDVNARIELAMEVSKALVNASNVTPGHAVSTKTTSNTVAPATGPAPYAGEWAGQFLGPDAGTVSIHVDENGVVQGQGVSSITSIGFSLAGKVSNTGKIDLIQTAAGATSTGATFSGTLTKGGRASGTWTMAAYNMSGTWELTVNAGQ